MATKPMQLCWDCKKACSGCDWSLTGTPIPGWTARQTQDANGVKSFAITACPEFVRDSYGFGASRHPPLTDEERAARRRKQARIASAKKYRRYTGEAGTTDDIET